MSLATLETQLRQLETLDRDARIRALIALADRLPGLGPRGEPWEVVDARQDNECQDLLTICARRQGEAVLLAAEAGPEVTTLTRALTALLVTHLNGETAEHILELDPAFVPRAIGDTLLRQRSASAHYPLRRVKEAVRGLERRAGIGTGE